MDELCGPSDPQPSSVAQVALQADGGCTEMPSDCQLSEIFIFWLLERNHPDLSRKHVNTAVLEMPRVFGVGSCKINRAGVGWKGKKSGQVIMQRGTHIFVLITLFF